MVKRENERGKMMERNDKLTIAFILFLIVYIWNLYNYRKLATSVGLYFHNITWIPTITIPSLFIIGSIFLYISKDFEKKKK